MTPTDTSVLVIGVAYDSAVEAERLANSFLNDAVPGIELVIADNSPDPPANLAALAAAHAGLEVRHFPDNPRYTGAGRAVLQQLAAERETPWPFSAVVLCNVDLQIPWAELVNTIASARDRFDSTAWVLAPDIVEGKQRWRANPFAVEPKRFRGRNGLMRRSVHFFRLYWALSLARRRWFENPLSELPAWSTIFAPAGAFIVFGAGWFRAGGVFHEGPLFQEEEAFGAMSAHIGVPVLWAPDLRIAHDTGASYRRRRGVGRRRFEWHAAAEAFYDDWDLSAITGSMSDWFTDRA